MAVDYSLVCLLCLSLAWGAKAMLLRYTTTSVLYGLCALVLRVTREHVAEHLLCLRRTLDVPAVRMACECAPPPPSWGVNILWTKPHSHSLIILFAEKPGPTFAHLRVVSLGFGKGKAHMRNDRAHKA